MPDTVLDRIFDEIHQIKLIIIGDGNPEEGLCFKVAVVKDVVHKLDDRVFVLESKIIPTVEEVKKKLEALPILGKVEVVKNEKEGKNKFALFSIPPETVDKFWKVAFRIMVVLFFGGQAMDKLPGWLTAIFGP